MNAFTLAEEIINGRRITREDDLSFFLTCDLEELCEGADKIREARIGDKVDLCSIINGRSGRCPEDCKYCAQSAHHHTNCEEYDFLPEEEILAACKMNEREGVDRFSIVTAGRALTGEEFDKAIHAYETMKKECKIDLCASMGFLSAEQLHRLHEAGVTSYHHNIETSRRNHPENKIHYCHCLICEVPLLRILHLLLSAMPHNPADRSLSLSCSVHASWCCIKRSFQEDPKNTPHREHHQQLHSQTSKTENDDICVSLSRLPSKDKATIPPSLPSKH